MENIYLRAISVEERQPKEPLQIYNVLIGGRLPMTAMYRNKIDGWWTLGMSDAKPLKEVSHWIEIIGEIGGNKIDNSEEWHKIGNKLTFYLGICGCQRKLKSFVNLLCDIRIKIENHDWGKLTAEQLMITALLNKNGITEHGTNCEYPFIGKMEFWNWLNSIKDSPYLEDN